MPVERFPILGFPAPSERYDRDNEAQFRRQLEQLLVRVTELLANQVVQAPITDDANRGSPGFPGRIIFNLDDTSLNYDDGTNWRKVIGGVT